MHKIMIIIIYLFIFTFYQEKKFFLFINKYILTHEEPNQIIRKIR